MLYEQLQIIYDDKTSKYLNYTVQIHAAWADENNYGMTHFGLSPKILKYNAIIFDTFHMMCQISRKLMDNLRRFMSVQSYENKNKFHLLLRNEWGHFNTLVWAGKKK